MKGKALCMSMAVLLVLVCSSSSYAAEVIKLKYSNYFPPTHKIALYGGELCDEIKKRTNGRVDISYYPGGTLTTAPKVFNGVQQGISDIGLSNCAYTRGRFPVMEANDLPVGFPSAWVGTQVTNDFYNKFRPKEWDNVQVLYFHTCGPSMVHTLTKPVKTLEDLKGMKIRATGRVADIVKTLGAVPMPLEMADMYDSMRRGVVDGNCGPYEQLKGWKIGELVKYATASWKAGSIYTFYVVMNKNKWNALPSDIQKIFTEVAAEYKERYAVLWNEYDIDGREFLQSKGGQTILLSDEEAKKWQKAVEPVINEFTQDLISKGFSKKEVDGYISYIRERIDYWAKEEKTRRIPTAY